MQEIINTKLKELINKKEKLGSILPLEYFYKNIVGINQNETIHYIEQNNYYISIIKDKIERMQNGNAVMKRDSRICIFYSLNYYDILDCVKDTELNKNISLTKEGKTIFNNDVINGLQETIMNQFKKEHSSWFVRSYVDLILYIDNKMNQIDTSNFYITQWNTLFKYNRLSAKKNVFDNVSSCEFVLSIENELKNIEQDNKDVIDCARAFEGNLDLYELTRKNYEEVKYDIDNNIAYSIIQGPARCGKTIIAMRLLKDYPDSKLILMNYYFYQALVNAFKVIGSTFPTDKIFHHNIKYNEGCWYDKEISKPKIDLSFTIVDECQRVGIVSKFNDHKELDIIKEIVNSPHHKHTIFLGDILQKVNPKIDQGFSLIDKYIDHKSVNRHIFSETIGIPVEAINNIKYLLDTSGKTLCCPSNYQIELIEDENEFKRLFNDDNSKRNYVYPSVLVSKTGIESIKPLPKEYNDLSKWATNKEVRENFALSTYHIISRELESVYLCIPEEIKLSTLESSEFVYSHLYILMTRATQKIRMYVKDDSLRNHFKKRIKFLNIKNETEQEEDDLLFVLAS